MRDPAGPPAWLVIAVGLLWAFAFGVWRERHRPGGTYDQVAELEAERDDALEAVDELIAANRVIEAEIYTRRNAAMRAHPSACCEQRRDLHVVTGGRA